MRYSSKPIVYHFLYKHILGVKILHRFSIKTNIASILLKIGSQSLKMIISPDEVVTL